MEETRIKMTEESVGGKMKAFAVIRADDSTKVKTALHDLVRYGHISFEGKPRSIEPSVADDILVNVMKSPLKHCCDAAAVVSLQDHASAAIGRLKKIHPPAHVIIVSPRHEVYNELVDSIEEMPEIDMKWRGNPERTE